MNAGQGATRHRDGFTMLSFPSNLSKHWVLGKGDRVVMETAGGGGCGKPA